MLIITAAATSLPIATTANAASQDTEGARSTAGTNPSSRAHDHGMPKTTKTVLSTVVVQGGRLKNNLVSPTRQVTVLEREEIEALRAGSSNLATMRPPAWPTPAARSRISARHFADAAR
ncbi:hypothetical protein [Solilutibacter pythonis]|uniref:hypothetical protein n=1 Tax=Solilutibacter pythonis TaxID=2483112 RepID=UPI001B87201E|nr:hypothetical protein [Lysobacter pythonis]